MTKTEENIIFVTAVSYELCPRDVLSMPYVFYRNFLCLLCKRIARLRPALWKYRSFFLTTWQRLCTFRGDCRSIFDQKGGSSTYPPAAFIKFNSCKLFCSSKTDLQNDHLFIVNSVIEKIKYTHTTDSHELWTSLGSRNKSYRMLWRLNWIQNLLKSIHTFFHNICGCQNVQDSLYM